MLVHRWHREISLTLRSFQHLCWALQSFQPLRRALQSFHSNPCDGLCSCSNPCDRPSGHSNPCDRPCGCSNPCDQPCNWVREIDCSSASCLYNQDETTDEKVRSFRTQRNSYSDWGWRWRWDRILRSGWAITRTGRWRYHKSINNYLGLPHGGQEFYHWTTIFHAFLRAT